MKRIIVVDDEPLILNATCNYIEQNFEVEAYRAISAFEALNMLKKMSYDVVITDISMPVMDGIELTRNVKRLWPQCYVIIQTVYDRFDYAFQALKFNRIDYVLKRDRFATLHTALQKAFDCIDEENRKEQFISLMGRHIDLLLPRIQDEVIHHLLHQRSGLPDDEKMQMIHFDVDTKQSVLLAIADFDSSHHTDLPMYLPAIENTLQMRVTEARIRVRLFISGDNMVCFVQYEKEEPENAIACIQDSFERCMEALEQNSGILMSVAMTNAFVEWSSIPDVYSRLKMDLGKIRNQSALILCDPSIPVPDARRSCISIDSFNELWTLLCAGDGSQVHRSLSDLLHPLYKIENVAEQIPFAERYALSYLYVQLSEIFELSIEANSAFFQTLVYPANMSGYEWSNCVLDLFDNLLARRFHSSVENNNSLISQIEEYIREHYNEDIHLSTIAEAFHYSASYISRLYKEHTGTNVSNGINNVRIEFAKKLIRSTTLSVNEIGQKCGFYSSKYFMQVFKKTTGMTPTQYRQNC